MSHIEPIFIASGPVIIEEGKVLLNRTKYEDGIGKWGFPGGRVEDTDSSLEETCHREVKEEMNLEIEIIRPLRTLVLPVTKPREGHGVFAHYVAKRIGEVTPGDDIVDWAWHDIHNLPDECHTNVKRIIEEMTKDI